jgi:hypothetical protein
VASVLAGATGPLIGQSRWAFLAAGVLFGAGYYAAGLHLLRRG